MGQTFKSGLYPGAWAAYGGRKGAQNSLCSRKRIFSYSPGLARLARALSPFSFSFSLSVELPFLDTVKPPPKESGGYSVFL